MAEPLKATVVGLGVSLMSYGINARAAMVALEEGKIAVAKED